MLVCNTGVPSEWRDAWRCVAPMRLGANRAPHRRVGTAVAQRRGLLDSSDRRQCVAQAVQYVARAAIVIIMIVSVGRDLFLLRVGVRQCTFGATERRSIWLR